jgi:hypothetical protein
MSRPLAAFTAVALATTMAACASGPGRGGPPPGAERTGAAYRASTFLSGAALLFVQFDADKDYATSRTEAEAGARAEWARASEGAATITPIQFEAWAARALGGPNIGPYRLAFDTNVNNEITQPEFIAAILARFDRFDADKDAVVRRQEMVERVPEPPRGPAGADGPAGERSPHQRLPGRYAR